MDILRIILKIIFVILGVSLTVVVLLQEGKSSGLGAVAGSGGDTYWSKNKSRSAEGALEKFTKYTAIAFVLMAIVLDLKFWA